MNRRILRIASIFICALAALPGCEPFSRNLRPRSQDDPLGGLGSHSKSKSESKEDEVGDGESPKGFFKSSRLSGAMSSEGREIEQSLGIR